MCFRLQQERHILNVMIPNWTFQLWTCYLLCSDPIKVNAAKAFASSLIISSGQRLDTLHKEWLYVVLVHPLSSVYVYPGEYNTATLAATLMLANG